MIQELRGRPGALQTASGWYPDLTAITCFRIWCAGVVASNLATCPNSIWHLLIIISVMFGSDLVMGKISYEDKMRIETFHEICFGYWIIVTNFPEKSWKRSSVKAISLSFFISQLSLCSTNSVFERSKFDTLHCWSAKIKLWIWCCTTSPYIN